MKYFKFLLTKIPLFLSVASLAGCSHNIDNVTPAQDLTLLPTSYDYYLIDNARRPTSLDQVVQSALNADVIFIGEYHGNHASHLLESEFLSSLHRAQGGQRALLLSMEMFTRSQQSILNDYLEGKIGEEYLVEEAPAWNGYRGQYRPLIEYAKQNNMPVIASNAPNDLVRCIGRQGASYIEKLMAEEKQLLARDPFATIDEYEEKFFGVLAESKHTPSERMRNSYLGQLARDNTMAESIARELAANEGVQVVHINGTFHSEDNLGAVAALRRLAPELEIRVITPVHYNTLETLGERQLKDDFYYILNPQPEAFVNEEYRVASFKKKFAKASEKASSCR